MAYSCLTCSSVNWSRFALSESAAILNCVHTKVSIPRSAQLAVRSVKAALVSNGSHNSSDEGGKAGFFEEAVELLKRAPVLPALAVLDLDHTIWPFYCSQFRSVYYQPTLFPQVFDLIKALVANEVALAIASRTPTPITALAFLDKLNLRGDFVAMEMYFTLSSKLEHFKAISEKTGLPFSSLLFFDDEPGNIEEVSSQLGVVSVLVEDGLCLKSLEVGLSLFSARYGSSADMDRLRHLRVGKT